MILLYTMLLLLAGDGHHGNPFIGKNCDKCCGFWWQFALLHWWLNFRVSFSVLYLAYLIKLCLYLIGRQHGDELFSRRSTSRTTTTAKHPVSDTAHLPSLSCTHYSSNSIFYVSLLQILAFSYLLSWQWQYTCEYISNCFTCKSTV